MKPIEVPVSSGMSSIDWGKVDLVIVSRGYYERLIQAHGDMGPNARWMGLRIRVSPWLADGHLGLVDRKGKLFQILNLNQDGPDATRG